MHILGYFVLSLARVFEISINLYMILVAAAVLISWIQPDSPLRVIRFVQQMTEPVFLRIRKRLPDFLQSLSIDISPLVVLIVLIFLETFLIGVLTEWGTSLVKK